MRARSGEAQCATRTKGDEEKSLGEAEDEAEGAVYSSELRGLDPFFEKSLDELHDEEGDEEGRGEAEDAGKISGWRRPQERKRPAPVL